jgi:hypothetical protein
VAKNPNDHYLTRALSPRTFVGTFCAAASGEDYPVAVYVLLEANAAFFPSAATRLRRLGQGFEANFESQRLVQVYSLAQARLAGCEAFLPALTFQRLSRGQFFFSVHGFQETTAGDDYKP